MEGWEIVLLVVAALLAARSLASMMRKRHDRLVQEVQKQVDDYQADLKANPPKKSQPDAA